MSVQAIQLYELLLLILNHVFLIILSPPLLFTAVLYQRVEWIFNLLSCSGESWTTKASARIDMPLSTCQDEWLSGTATGMQAFRGVTLWLLFMIYCLIDLAWPKRWSYRGSWLIEGGHCRLSKGRKYLACTAGHYRSPLCYLTSLMMIWKWFSHLMNRYTSLVERSRILIKVERLMKSCLSYRQNCAKTMYHTLFILSWTSVSVACLFNLALVHRFLFH